MPTQNNVNTKCHYMPSQENPKLEKNVAGLHAT